jgi:hypothetical protein
MNLKRHAELLLLLLSCVNDRVVGGGNAPAVK